MTTPEYYWWWGKRVNDNISTLSQENTRPIKKHLQVIPSQLEIIMQDFEKMSLELGRKIEQLEEEKMRLGLDVDIQKLEAKKLRKENNKTEEHLDSLKTDYKKLRLSIRTASLGKTSEQWWQEIKEEKTQLEAYPRKVPISIRPQQCQAGTSVPTNYLTGSGSNPLDNPTNPIVLYLDDIAEMEKARVDLPK
ncbi:hypothetical protein Goklo_025210 [Gossypium klotzschianum]|uniref:Uncharacterized protein n=1 Tax=Gossypium klotzschianum TaxID=34286 RepID=A0A7J8WCT3_9ROSI|nr:hypothetical protein [Gossypium klotzschianum]